MRELESYGEGAFFVEFSRWPDRNLEYRIFKRHFLFSESDLKKELAKCKNGIERHWLRVQNEVHPYQLLFGEVNEQPNVVSFNTKKFLKFTIDSLNKNYERT